MVGKEIEHFYQHVLCLILSICTFYLANLLLEAYFSFVLTMSSYNPASATLPPPGWSAPVRPEPWFTQNPAVSLPPVISASPTQVQPLFPIQNVRPPLPATTAPSFQPPFPISPPGLPATVPPISQPLFPITSTNNIPGQSVSFATPVAPVVPSSSPAEVKISVVANYSSGPSIGSSYSASNVQGMDAFLLNYVDQFLIQHAAGLSFSEIYSL